MTGTESLCAAPDRAGRYAAKYVNESSEFPDDEAIASALRGCVRQPRREEYEAIRTAVLAVYPARLRLPENGCDPSKRFPEDLPR